MSLCYLPRLLTFEIKRCSYILAATPKFTLVQSASITSKEWRDPNIKKPAPWPYETKKFTFLHPYWEGTVKRFDENTKIIVVEGNIAAGKSQFAKQLAEAFDFKYFPEPDLVQDYITHYGYDLRELDPIVPRTFKSFTLENFYKEPKHYLVSAMQFRMFMHRLESYIDALAHLLSTGQGVVMDRCAYSDFVFMEAMFKYGCFRKEIREFYHEITEATLEELLRPHLIVYLDVTPEVALERIKKRDNAIEKDSPILTTEYLKDLEYFYKQCYLKEFQKHSEVLIYDWNNFGDVEVVVEDIERIDFERFTKYDSQLEDWRKEDDWEWGYFRQKYCNNKMTIMGYACRLKPQYHEVYNPPDEVEEYVKIIDKVPGGRYLEGFNRNAGDKVWFNVKSTSYRYKGKWRSFEQF